MSPYNRLQRDLGNCCWGRSLRWDHPLDRQSFPCCGVQFHKHAALAMWNISNTILLELGEGDVTSIRFSPWEAWVCCSTRTLSFPRPRRVAPFTVFRTRLTKIYFFPSAIILELVQWTLMSHGNIAFLGFKCWGVAIRITWVCWGLTSVQFTTDTRYVYMSLKNIQVHFKKW